MKKLLIFSALLIFACGSDDSNNDEDDNSNQNFLEKYDGVIWKGTNNNQGDNASDDGWEYWLVFNPNGYYNCEFYLGSYESYSSNWGQIYSVIENSSERLVLESIGIGEDGFSGVTYLTTIETTNVNNIMILTPGLEGDESDYIEYYERVSSHPCE